MRDAGVIGARGGEPLNVGARSRHLAPGPGRCWAFVYVFFTNGIPFDAPNRSEPCCPS
jgi:hypothetical protein